MDRRRTIATPLVAAGVLLLSACEASVEVGERVVDSAEVESEIANQLEAEVGQRPASVDCPDEIQAAEGETYRCTLTAEDGSTIGLTLTMTDDEGNFDFEVDQG